MPILPDPVREAGWQEFMQLESSDRQAFAGLTKADLRAAMDATDNWIEGALASFNASLPPPARNALTARQKARLFSLVMRYRYGVTL